MESNISLPCNINELQKLNVDWKILTNDYDYDKIKAIISQWEKFEDQRAVIFMIYNSMVCTNSFVGRNVNKIQPVVDLIQLYRFEKGSERYNKWLGYIKEREERNKREEWERLQNENKSLKEQVEKLKEDLKKEKELVEGRTRELDKMKALLEYEENNCNKYISENEFLKSENENLRNRNDLLKELINEKGGDQKFSVRQTTIVAYALCKKAEVLPKNKKNISMLFSRMTGYSQNTIGQKMCGNFEDKEIEKIAEEIDNKMPDLANYLREKSFFLPERKK